MIYTPKEYLEDRLQNPQRSQLNTIQSIVLYLFLIVNTFQYSIWGIFEPIYGYLRVLSIILVILLALTIPIKRVLYTIKANQFTRWFCILLGVFSLLSFSLYAFFNANIDFSTHRDLLLTIITLIIGYNLSLSKGQLARYIYTYIIAASISALSILMRFGIHISSFYFEGVYKNQIGVFLGIFSIISISLLFSQDIKNRRKRNVLLLCSIILLLTIAILRARTSLLFVFAVIVYSIAINKSMKTKNKLFIFVCIAVILIAFSGEIYRIFVANKDVSDLNNISSGRIGRILDGLTFLKNHPLSGGLWHEKYNGGIIHVYILKRIVDYGLLLSIPIIILYVYTWCVTLKNILVNKRNFINALAPLILLFILLVSLNEYSYPFSPLSSIFIVYLLFGNYLSTSTRH